MAEREDEHEETDFSDADEGQLRREAERLRDEIANQREQAEQAQRELDDPA